MKNSKILLLYGFIATMISISCRTNYPYRNSRDASRDFVVNKIDSISDCYLIYARRNDTLFKIISQKKTSQSCNRIVVNSRYAFSLVPILYDGAVKISSNNIGGVYVNDSTIIRVEGDSVRELYTSKNIKGLCFTGR